MKNWAGGAPPLIKMFSIYEQLDALLKAQGRLLEAGGVGPEESPYRVVLEGPVYRLRDYGGGESGPVILVVPAPIKKAYLWDLFPESSVIRRLLRGGFRVFLIEWKAPGPGHDELGLSEYAGSFILNCFDKISGYAGEENCFLVGHSLGGTLAAIFSSYRPERIKGLVLAAGPVHFGAGVGCLDTAVALFGGLRDVVGIFGNVPGSFLDVVATGADPETFFFYPLRDLMESMEDSGAMRTHLAVRRWMLDETPLPKKLFKEVVELLYRDDVFMRGLLKLDGSSASPERIDFPVLAIIDRDCRIVTPRSVLPFFEKIKSTDTQVLWYAGDKGILFRHAGVLVGKNAQGKIWPEVVSWIQARS